MVMAGTDSGSGCSAKPIRVAVVGSIAFEHVEIVRAYVDALPLHTVVISGGAKGVDTVAQEAAQARGLDTLIFPADWNTHGRAAGPIRNKQIVDAADQVVAFWNGSSRGTLNTVVLALAAGKFVTPIGENGETVRLSEVLTAAETRGVMAAIRAADPAFDLDEAVIRAALRRCADWKWRDVINGITGHYGATRVLANVHALDLMRYAEGWGRSLRSSKNGWLSEWTRAKAVESVAGRDDSTTDFDSPLAHLNAREAYSFVLRRSFHGNSLIRVADYDGRIVMSGFIGGARFVTETEDLFREMTEEEWRTLRSSIGQSAFWDMPEKDDRLGLDGDTWIVEGRIGYHYHYIKRRWCPDDPEIRRLGEAFLSMARTTRVCQ
jgi:hypothetical protein